MAARKFPMTGNTVMALILEVKSHPCLWDPEHNHYNDRHKIAKTWQQISATIGIQEDCLRAKWKNLRDLFKREEKKTIASKDYICKWRHYSTLLFLQRHDSEAAKSESSSDDDTQASFESEYLEVKKEKEDEVYEILINKDQNENSCLLQELPEPEVENTKQVKKMKLSNDDDDYDTMFLQSLTPFFRELELCRKLVVRNKIQDIIRAELFAQNNFVLPH